MEQNKLSAIAVIVIVVSAGALVAVWYTGTLPTTTTTPENPVVRMGYLSKDLHQLALQVALVNGWFDEANITIQLSEYQNGGYEMDGFLAEQIDMGYLGAAPAIVKRINQNTMVTILAAVNLEGSALMVSKEEYDAGHVTEVADLVGKTVYYPGVPTVQAFLLRLALNQSGIGISDITPQTASVTYMEDLLTADAPAFIAWEPFCAKAEENEKAVPLLLSGDIWHEHPCCVVAASNSFLAENPETVEKVIDIHKRAQDWIVANPTNATEIAIDWLEMNESIVELAFSRIIYDYAINQTRLEMTLEFWIHEGLIDMDPADIGTFFDSFIDTSFIDE